MPGSVLKLVCLEFGAALVTPPSSMFAEVEPFPLNVNMMWMHFQEGLIQNVKYVQKNTIKIL